MRQMDIVYTFTLILVYTILPCHAKIMRNNALMNKMMTQFHKDNNLSVEKVTEDQAEPKVFALMQDVLCRNFPTIPCEVIVQDTTLKRLIEKSIQEINYKKRSMERTTAIPHYKTGYPVINSEDLSNFLQVQNTGYFGDVEGKFKTRKHKTINTQKDKWSPEKVKKTKRKKSAKRTSLYGRKNLRKFYPHKIKYKDKESFKPGYKEHSDEKVSLSMETPDMGLSKQHQHYSYKVEPYNAPVWRIDYTKHGEPSLNLLGSLTKTGSNVLMDDDAVNRSARKEVLHPDLYIKKNYVRRNSELVD